MGTNQELQPCDKPEAGGLPLSKPAATRSNSDNSLREAKVSEEKTSSKDRGAAV